MTDQKMALMKDLQAHKKWARIQEVKDLEENNENIIRIYCVQYPDVFAFQIRTHKPITGPFGRGKPKNMIAHVELSLTEMEEILAFMKAYTGKSPRVNTMPLDKVENEKG